MIEKTLSRRAFSVGLAGAPAILLARAGTQEARVKIDTERTIGSVDKKIYGNFTEHLGRCIEGGIFEENSPLSDSEGFRKDVLKAVDDLHVSQLRWPGGNFSSNYNWKDGIGPRDNRPARLEMAWHTIEDNRFGTHEFLRYCEVTKCEPYVCTNMGTGTWTEAQQWVEYCNLAEGTAMTELRKKNGRAEPWGVKYWGLGNEMDGPWQMGHRSAEEYGKYALEAAKLMKWTDPSIKLIAAGSSNFAADWIGWNRTVLQYLKHHADYLSLHLYVGNPQNNFPEFLASSLELDNRIKIAAGLIREALSDEPGREIYIAWDEWNVWYRARGEGKQSGRRILEEQYNLEDALVVATFLNAFINNADVVKIANMAQLVNVIAPIFTSKDALYLQTIFYPLSLIAGNSSGKALELFMECPTYSTAKYKAVPYLDISSTLDNGTLVVNVVNRHPSESVTATFELEDKRYSGDYQASEVNGPDVKSQNTFGSEVVKTTVKAAAAQGNKLRYSFPAHSFTMLKGKVS